MYRQLYPQCFFLSVVVGWQCVCMSLLASGFFFSWSGCTKKSSMGIKIHTEARIVFVFSPTTTTGWGNMHNCTQKNIECTQKNILHSSNSWEIVDADDKSDHFVHGERINLSFYVYWIFLVFFFWFNCLSADLNRIWFLQIHFRSFYQLSLVAHGFLAISIEFLAFQPVILMVVSGY